MDPERWARLEELFQEALSLETAARTAFLEAPRGTDGDLRAELASLLAAHEGAGSFLAAPAVASLTAQSPVAARPFRHGCRVGPYTVLREIGRGGMGCILLAERGGTGHPGRVAIKVVDAVGAAPDLVARSRRERAILAGLDHPSIARLLDAGSLPTGRPYLVMEHVDGVPIDEHCGRRRLTVEERLRLFGRVCDAVTHAHRRRIVHRDLKPDNVLVTREGRPKLVDFGIAKLLDPDAGRDLTRTWQVPMTLRYASPEQARGRAVGTATDVYSLGVLLYEILAGRSPYEVAEATPLEVLRQVVEVEPRRPSAVVDEAAAAARGTGLGALRRRLRGDLDNIVLKALQKAPARRYASVRELADDLRRHLEGLSVDARADTLADRGIRFCRRNPVAASLGVAHLVSLAVFAAVLGAQDRRHREHRPGRPDSRGASPWISRYSQARAKRQ